MQVPAYVCASHVLAFEFNTAHAGIDCIDSNKCTNGISVIRLIVALEVLHSCFQCLHALHVASLIVVIAAAA